MIPGLINDLKSFSLKKEFLDGSKCYLEIINDKNLKCLKGKTDHEFAEHASFWINKSLDN